MFVRTPLYSVLWRGVHCQDWRYAYTIYQHGLGNAYDLQQSLIQPVRSLFWFLFDCQWIFSGGNHHHRLIACKEWRGSIRADIVSNSVELVEFDVISRWSEGDRSVPISCRIRSNSSNSTLFRGGVRGIDPCRHCVEFGQTREIDDIDV